MRAGTDTSFSCSRGAAQDNLDLDELDSVHTHAAQRAHPVLRSFTMKPLLVPIYLILLIKQAYVR